MEKTRSFLLVMLCAVLALLTGNAGAEEQRGEELSTGAKAAVLIEKRTGRVLYRHNESAALPMASTTKVMTALMALENARLDELVTVGHNAYGVPGTSIYLDEGEQITMENLLYGLMLASGNDAAVAIAEHVAGSVESFCERMTLRARELGCTVTRFVNPHGLPVAGHQTTALELALIARAAMDNDDFRRLVSTQRAAIPWAGRSYDRILNNKNRLLSEYAGATGIKTGYTKAAGRCLVFGAERDGLEVVGVVLNCADWFDEATRILDLGFREYEWFTAYGAGELFRVLPVTDGRQETAEVYARGELSALIRRGRLPSMEIELPDSVRAGARMGETLGFARLVLDGETLAETALTLHADAEERDYAFSLERVLQQWLPFHTIAD